VLFLIITIIQIPLKKQRNRASVLEDFMTDAVAKSTLICKAASQYEINRDT